MVNYINIFYASIFEKNTAVQKAISDKNSEINDLKSSISELRNQLEKLKFEKKAAP